MDIPKVNPIKVDKVDDKVFAEYKERLAKKLMKYNMHADAIFNKVRMITGHS